MQQKTAVRFFFWKIGLINFSYGKKIIKCFLTVSTTLFTLACMQQFKLFVFLKKIGCQFSEYVHALHFNYKL